MILNKQGNYMNTKTIALIIIAGGIFAFSTAFGAGLSKEQINKFAEMLSRNEDFTQEQLNSMSADDEKEITDLAAKYSDEMQNRVSNYKELTDSQVQELRNKLTEISKLEGTRSIAKALSERADALSSFLHDRAYDRLDMNKKQLQDKLDKLTADIIKTAQQIDDYRVASANLSYSLAEHLKQLHDLNVLFSSFRNPNDQALKNELYRAQFDAKKINDEAFNVAVKSEL